MVSGSLLEDCKNYLSTQKPVIFAMVPPRVEEYPLGPAAFLTAEHTLVSASRPGNFDFKIPEMTSNTESALALRPLRANVTISATTALVK